MFVGASAYEILHNPELFEVERARNEEMAAIILELQVRLEEKSKSPEELRRAFEKEDKSSYAAQVRIIEEFLEQK